MENPIEKAMDLHTSHPQHQPKSTVEPGDSPARPEPGAHALGGHSAAIAAQGPDPSGLESFVQKDPPQRVPAPGPVGRNQVVEPIPPEVPAERRWKVGIERDLNGEVSRMTLSSKFGELTYGARPYPAWVFREVGGGGAVTLPYTKSPEGELLVGLLLEDRPNMGGEQWCITGGFIDPGETHLDAGIRETMEEIGIMVPPVIELGMPMNSNRQFFDADPSKGEGVKAFGMELPHQWLEPREGGGFRLRDGIQVGVKNPQNLAFFPAKEAITKTGDALALGAIAKLWATN